MLEIDGSQKSGSGTILRLSISLAGILGEPLHLYNVRQKRTQPGLRPQHLEAALTAAKLCNAEIKGATLGSRELWFKPNEISGGEIYAEIGTAGSIPMLFLTILPLCAFAKRTVRVHVVKGGTDIRNAPTINFLKHLLLPILERMGLKTSLTVQKYGYYPKGMGEVFLEIQPCDRLASLQLEQSGAIEQLEGVSVCTFLEDRRVAKRQAKAANQHLRAQGYEARIRIVNDRSNPFQKGSSITLWAETDKGALVGADAIGELKKTSEAVGREAAEKLHAEISSTPTVDVHLADMLIPYVALAEGTSTFLTKAVSDHLEANVWLAEKMLNVRFNIQKRNKLFRIEKSSS